ncbi:hypothetical protein KFE25_002925 [Diacronema lutheri]|uniref:Mitogen-activated protein kinase n=2 Tax=Diacronema lutheri TaxID=2081491 RepID=A0A8J5XES1_DIALT|nr:hypothetical protein KFE25_002925 [Diacronema lutheri]
MADTDSASAAAASNTAAGGVPRGGATLSNFVEHEHRVTSRGTKLYNIVGMNFETDAKYAVKKAVGQGAYGLVCSARLTETGEGVAIKKIPKAFDDIIDCKRLLREIKILKHFKHDNVLGIKDILCPPSKKWKDIYIVSELADTDLHYIIHSKQPLTEEHHKYFLYQILRGVKAIHSAGVLHRDLKPGNLLVNKNCDLKVCDFGLARAMRVAAEKGPVSQLTEYVVTRWYRAPELLVEVEDYDSAIDVWAIGCIFAEMLGRKALFPGRDYLDQLKRIIDVIGTPTEADLRAISNPQAVKFLKDLPKKSKRPWADIYPKANPLALELLDRMLAFDPANRISVVDALAHPYLQPLHNEKTEPEAKPFSFAFDKPDISQAQLREQIWAEMAAFHPEAKDLPDIHRDDE